MESIFDQIGKLKQLTAEYTRILDAFEKSSKIPREEIVKGVQTVSYSLEEAYNIWILEGRIVWQDK